MDEWMVRVQEMLNESKRDAATSALLDVEIAVGRCNRNIRFDDKILYIPVDAVLDICREVRKAL